MIRINLINNKVKTGEPGEGQGILITNDKESQKENIIKIILMLMFVVGLYFYESQNVETLTQEFNKFKKVADTGAAEVKKLRSTAGKAESVESEINKLQEKLKILQDLSRKRLRELKALDFLQTMVPDGVWLNSINYDGEKFLFDGSAVNDKELDLFVTGLNDSTYFNEVVVLKQVETKSESGSVKTFQISSLMGIE